MGDPKRAETETQVLRMVGESTVVRLAMVSESALLEYDTQYKSESGACGTPLYMSPEAWAPATGSSSDEIQAYIRETRAAKIEYRPYEWLTLDQAQQENRREYAVSLLLSLLPLLLLLLLLS